MGWNVMPRRSDGIRARVSLPVSNSAPTGVVAGPLPDVRALEAEHVGVEVTRRVEVGGRDRDEVDAGDEGAWCSCLLLVRGLWLKLLGEPVERAREPALGRAAGRSVISSVVWKIISVRPSPRSVNVTVASPNTSRSGSTTSR